MANVITRKQFRGDEIVLEVFKQELILRQKIYKKCEILFIY